MKQVKLFVAVVAPLLAFMGCQNDMTTETIHQAGKTTLSISLAQSRTSLGEKVGDNYPTYWSEGDCISVNGVESKEVIINPDDASRATFTIDKVMEYPYSITYPHTANSTKESPKVVFAAEQSYTEGSFVNGSAPMCGYVEQKSNSIQLNHLAGILRFALHSEDGVDTSLKSVTINASKALSGEFVVDCQNATITPTENSGNSITYTLPNNFALSADEDQYIYIAVPHGALGTCHLVFTDSQGKKMKAQWNGSNVTPGIVKEFNSITFRETDESVMLEEMTETFIDEWGTEKGVTIKGYVKSNGKGLEGVVVSDGLLCTKTNVNGFYSLKSNLADAKFVMVSIPSGYTAPTDANGLPIFYHRVTAAERKANMCVADFSFNKIASNADRFTLLVGADPQPRPSSYGFDNNAYHSLDCCEDLYRDMREKAATITDRNVYGLMLGDIVHEAMGLFDDYIAGLKTLNFPMFNVLGNHDNDKTAKTDVEGRRVFEEKLGPTNYSFNIGNVHFVVLDNLIMKLEGESDSQELTGSDQGLTDEIWQWLQNDLSHVDRSKILMVAAHSPMTKLRTGGSRTTSAKHFADYTALFAEFAQAHIWSGHTHKTFNYNYPQSSALYPIEEHTVARSTGELWTNEYEVGGTPRGYVVVDVDGNNVSWKFKPTIYQSGSFSTKTTAKPNYIYRDWNYLNGVAKMKSNGSTLSESYQMKVYAPGTYHDTFSAKMNGDAANDYIYVNVFMWDDKWQTPTFNGQNMEHIKYNTAYELAEYEIMNHYSTYGYTLNGYASYGYEYGKDVYVHTIFRIKAPSATGTGTINVVDRFGNNYSSTISW